MKRDKVLLLCILALTACVITWGVVFILSLKPQEDTGESTPSTEQPAVTESPEETETPEDVDPYYEVHARDDVKNEFDTSNNLEWMLVVEEDISIEFTPPEYDPDDWRPAVMQESYNELDIELQMLSNYVENFMVTNRGYEEYTVDPNRMGNGFGFYLTSYLAAETDEDGHTVQWWFIMGKLDDTPEDHYSVLVYRADVYAQD